MPIPSLKICTLIVCLTASTAFAQDPASERVQAAQGAYDAAVASLDMGAGTAEEVYRWSRRWLESVKQGDKTLAAVAVSAHLARMEALQVKVTGLVAGGMVPGSADAACRYYVAEAKVWNGG